MPSRAPEEPSRERGEDERLSGGPTARSRAGGADQPTDERLPREPYGPIGVARTVKDDGRALILYSHEERERA